ncbi:MAG: histidine phosphatase family protein, partial [Clostridia bacterium]|nr:histidine phosphatase family protein [Clostridia bacterium]
MLLYVVRHGDPDYENDSLTELGKLQAAALAKRLAVNGLDRVYTSPLGRAKMTAAPTCEALGIEPEILEWTSEDLAFSDLSVPRPEGGRTWSFGSCRNTEYRTKKTAALGDRWYEAYPFSQCTAQAGFERIRRGSDEFLSSLGYTRDGEVYRIDRPNDERVAVFCHYGSGTTWLSHLLSLAPPVFWGTFLINHSSFSVIRFPGLMSVEPFRHGLFEIVEFRLAKDGPVTSMTLQELASKYNSKA